jgi:hypothetical protein
MTSLIFWDVLLRTNQRREISLLPRFRASRKGGKPVLNDILKINLQPTISNRCWTLLHRYIIEVFEEGIGGKVGGSKLQESAIDTPVYSPPELAPKPPA